MENKEHLEIICKRYEELLELHRRNLNDFTESALDSLRKNHDSIFLDMVERLTEKNKRFEVLKGEYCVFRNMLDGFKK